MGGWEPSSEASAVSEAAVHFVHTIPFSVTQGACLAFVSLKANALGAKWKGLCFCWAVFHVRDLQPS